MAQSTIHYIETGQKSPTFRILSKLANALGVTVADLAGEQPTQAEVSKGVSA